MRGISMGMQEISVETQKMWEIRVAMQGIKVKT